VHNVLKNSGTKDGPFPGVSAPEMRIHGLALVDAFILSRVRYLAPRSTVIRSGHGWVAWPISLWAEKAGQSSSTIRRAIGKLKKLNLVEAEVHLLGSKTRLFLRPLVAANAQGERSAKAHDQSGSARMSTPNEFPPINSTLPCKEDERRKRMTEEEYPGTEKPETQEVQEDLLVHSSSLEDLDCDPLLILEKHWKTCWSTYQGTFCPSWNKSEHRLAQELLTKCLEAKVEAPQVIELAVSDWGGFMEYAAFKQGAYPLPDVPTLTAIAKWSNSLIWLYMEQHEALGAPTMLESEAP
jgi:hypothetical protein